MVGVAIQVTGNPEQTGFGDAVMLTETGRSGLTVMLIVFDVAGLPVGQVAVEFKMHETRSPFTDMYDIVDAFGQTPPPLTRH